MRSQAILPSAVSGYIDNGAGYPSTRRNGHEKRNEARKRLMMILLTICFVMTLTACQKNDGSVTIKTQDGRTLSLQLMDVWQDDDQNVMVTLAETGNGRLLDVVSVWSGGKIVGRAPRPNVQVKILVGEEWVTFKDYPEGMFEGGINGTLTIRYPVTVLPSQLDISGTLLELAKLTLPGVDRQALLSAEAEAARQVEERERQEAAAAARLRKDAQAKVPKEQLDTTWISSEPLAEGESIYYACTGLEKADAVGISFILSADRTTARDIQTLAINVDGGTTFYGRMKQVLKMSYPVENGRLAINKDGVLIDVTIDGSIATGIFGYSVKTGKNALGGGIYTDCGVAKIELTKWR